MSLNYYNCLNTASGAGTLHELPEQTASEASEALIQQLFDAVDANGSGFVEYDELHEWWLQRGGDPSVLGKLEAAFAIAGQAAGAVDRAVFREVLIAVAVDGWVEQTNPATGQPWYVHSVSGEASATRPGIARVSEWLYRSGITAAVLKASLGAIV